MTLFASDRERRLWLWTLAVMVAIYSTLGPARTVSAFLREHNLLRLSIGLAVLILLVVLVRQWFKEPRKWSEVGVALGVALAYLMVAWRMDSWEERTHLLEYGIVAALIHQALLERLRHGRHVPMPAALAIAATASLGLLDEVIQAFLPSRVFDFRDVFFNALAGFMVVAARLAIAPQKRPGWRLWFLMTLAGFVGWGWGVYNGWRWFDVVTEPKLWEQLPANLNAGFFGLVTGGLLLGVLQWLVLRGHLERAYRWILASVGALAVSAILMYGLSAVRPDVGWYLGITAYGTVVGVLQWMVLRAQVPRAGWWIAASTAAWLAGIPFGDFNGPPGLGGLYGVMAGAAMVWLLRRTPESAEAPPAS